MSASSAERCEAFARLMPKQDLVVGPSGTQSLGEHMMGFPELGFEPRRLT